VGRQRRLRAARAGLRRELRPARCRRTPLRAAEALRALSSLGALSSLRARTTLGSLPGLRALRELAGRREALRRLRAARAGLRRELRPGGTRAGNPGRTGRAERLLLTRCGRLALWLGGRPEQVRTFAALRLERSSVWAVLRRVRMGADGSLRRLWGWDWAAVRRARGLCPRGGVRVGPACSGDRDGRLQSSRQRP
ncbi:hypothetical protein, partial [Nocardiopsis metallicus]|uniref:hypothetical protein n=1 Tax=Nocardiopsis metallicus TaxID=179819 RepID=UPI0031D8AD60